MDISWGAILIIVLAIGIILSNIMLVKKTANMKMPESVVKRAEAKRRLEKERAAQAEEHDKHKSSSE